MRALLNCLLAILFAVFHSWVSITDHPAVWTLDNFEDGDLRAASGLSWIVLGDDLMGGATEARLELTSGAAETPRHALRVAGRLGSGGFAGAWISLDSTGRSLDLSAFEGVRLRVKGPAALDIGFRSGITNFMARVDAGPEWRLVEVPFDSMRPSAKAPEGAKFTSIEIRVPTEIHRERIEVELRDLPLK